MRSEGEDDKEGVNINMLRNTMYISMQNYIEYSSWKPDLVRNNRLSLVYIDVGIQEFISRSSDGLALITFGAPADDDFDCDVSPSSPSSLMCDDATDVVDDIVSPRCMPKKLDKNQPR